MHVPLQLGFPRSIEAIVTQDVGEREGQARDNKKRTLDKSAREKNKTSTSRLKMCPQTDRWCYGWKILVNHLDSQIPSLEERFAFTCMPPPLPLAPTICHVIRGDGAPTAMAKPTSRWPPESISSC